MSLVLRRYFKFSVVSKQCMSMCRPKPMAKECQNSLIPTMNELRVPNGTWIARYYLEERGLKRYILAGFGMVATSVATLIKTDVIWYGKNLQYAPDFVYDDAAQRPSKENNADIKVENVENVVNVSKQSPYVFVASVLAMVSVAKLFF